MNSFLSGVGPQGVALVGNPGGGKSAILNGIAGKSVFKSGISLGTGLTTVLDQYVCGEGNLTLFDTPGLADVKRRKQAGMEIDKMLRTNMSIKLAFVVTLERGRVRPDDAATLKVVLEAIKDVDLENKFGVIINQLTALEMELLCRDVTSAARVHKSITGSFQTSHWIYLPKIPELEDASDSKLMTEELITFFSGLPLAKPPDADVDEIDTSDVNEKIEEQRKRIKELEEANEEQSAEMIAEIHRQRQEAQERNAKLQEQLAGVKRQLEEARQKSEENRKVNGMFMDILKPLALTGGAIASILVGEPAIMIVAGALLGNETEPDAI